MFLGFCFSPAAFSSAVSGKLSILSLGCFIVNFITFSPIPVSARKHCSSHPQNVQLWDYWTRLVSALFYTKCSMIPLLHPSLTTFTIRVLFELLYAHGGKVSCSSSPGQMPGPTGLVSWMAGAVKRGRGASEYSLFFQCSEKRYDEFWGLQDHRVLTCDGSLEVGRCFSESSK